MRTRASILLKSGPTVRWQNTFGSHSFILESQSVAPGGLKARSTSICLQLAMRRTAEFMCKSHVPSEVSSFEYREYLSRRAMTKVVAAVSQNHGVLLLRWNAILFLSYDRHPTVLQQVGFAAPHRSPRSQLLRAGASRPSSVSQMSIFSLN